MARRADVFVDSANDPRDTGASLGDERTTLADYLRYHRQTLELKCSGLEPEDLARRSVEPSTLSLLGLLRHMADVERYWFRRVLARQEAPKYFPEPDEDFDGAVADPDLVARAWRLWREEVEFAERVAAENADLDIVRHTRHGEAVNMREVLVHMVEEYARHNGHADLLRERIDGRIGQ
jgi:uncharacterized damage-inducible protein DinB